MEAVELTYQSRNRNGDLLGSEDSKKVLQGMVRGAVWFPIKASETCEAGLATDVASKKQPARGVRGHSAK